MKKATLVGLEKRKRIQNYVIFCQEKMGIGQVRVYMRRQWRATPPPPPLPRAHRRKYKDDKKGKMAEGNGKGCRRVINQKLINSS